MQPNLTTAPRPRSDSWLSLVAETAGVADCSVVRVELSARGAQRRDCRVIVQVVSASGLVLGAAAWAGPAEALHEGAAVDLGYSGVDDAGTTQVIAWIDPSDVGTDPYFAEPPVGVASRPLNGARVRLGLSPAFSVAA